MWNKFYHALVVLVIFFSTGLGIATAQTVGQPGIQKPNAMLQCEVLQGDFMYVYYLWEMGVELELAKDLILVDTGLTPIQQFPINVAIDVLYHDLDDQTTWMEWLVLSLKGCMAIWGPGYTHVSMRWRRPYYDYSRQWVTE